MANNKKGDEIKLLENEMNLLKSDNNKKGDEINRLKENIDALNIDNNQKGDEINQLKENIDALNIYNKKNTQELNKKIENLHNMLESAINTNFNIGQEKLNIHESLKDIHERDNYSTLVYIILISTEKYSFEDIWSNTNNIVKKEEKSMSNKELRDILSGADRFLFLTNTDAHSPSDSNIFKKLFPNYANKFNRLFEDRIIKKTRGIIRGLKKYLNDKKINKEFGHEISNLTKEIISIKK